ncbi:flavodoxin family protein [Staphylococcus sp. NRL 16/872]|uniref:flavodoxin family protein n=1 Tax=Staphylococcus sp. NRL 16/872 TaxID=2930131 RepID=UPI001FB4938B|nr:MULTISPECIES: flavodoxin family protein [unclassified Staphylococcus]MCJ1657039.1 flavodoxin family protein [Staphylococcus sp. NRL 21/187]MCJ1668896.1 flavodoxin family protein [Staphylococcus sp. NRL 19/737]WEN69115.1 flavodoxin family protein [Staphylococcus sp. NRL 16/872]
MITVLFGGSRPEGNTAQITKYALEGLDYNWIDLTQYQLNPVRDLRHENEDIETYYDDYKEIIDKVLESDTVIFASPVYWYSISASLKAFIDNWSETLVDPNYKDFMEKMARIDFRLILVGGDCPKVKAKPCITQMKYTLDFIGAELQGYIIGTAERPGDIMKDAFALERAKEWNEALA